MAKEITLELLVETVARQGLAAARVMVDGACADVEAAIDRAHATIAAAQAQLEDLQKRRSMFQTLLIGAVKKASTEAGIELAAPAAGPTMAGGKPRGPRRTKGVYPETAEQFVQNLLKDKAATSSEIGQAWAASGRKGGPNKTLNILSKAGKIRREKLIGRKGSRYTLV
jgi:hypothetical protein